MEGEEPLHRLEDKAFIQMCYQLARENHGKVIALDTGLSDKNFYWVQFKLLYCTSMYLLYN